MLRRNIIDIFIQNETEFRRNAPNSEAMNVIVVLAFGTVFEQ
jgi:hypothetical protein